MKFDFTTSVQRAGTGSLKWDKYKNSETLPFWVADMDFVSSPVILEALRARVDHGVFGYTIPYAEVVESVLAYLRRQHGLTVDADWLVWLPGLVQGINLSCRAYGGDVMTLTPIYPPFLSAPIFSGKKRVVAPMVPGSGRWEVDFEAMENAVTPETRLLLLCNPHNPVGRVFTREELEGFLDFCERHDLVLCSDEIHCDLILDDVPHIPTLAFGDRAASRTITLMAPSKTYNVPGLACSYAIIPDEKLRHTFRQTIRGLITEVNCFGYAGCAAAYTHGEPWRQDMLAVLRANRDLLYAFVAREMPEIGILPMEATYLAWMDMRNLPVENPGAFFEAAGVGLSNGVDFGFPGFLRLNFGCPTDMLREGLERMARAVQSLR